MSVKNQRKDSKNIFSDGNLSQFHVAPSKQCLELEMTTWKLFWYIVDMVSCGSTSALLDNNLTL